MPPPEHAVIARYTLANEALGDKDERQAIYALGQCLDEAIKAAEVGEFDGNEFGGGEVVLYAYGPDATRLFAAMEPHLRAFPTRPGHVTLRFGQADDSSAAERHINL